MSPDFIEEIRDKFHTMQLNSMPLGTGKVYAELGQIILLKITDKILSDANEIDFSILKSWQSIQIRFCL